MVIHLYAKIWYAYVKEQKHLARLKYMMKNVWYWGQMSRSYRVHKCMRDIVAWRYSHVPNKVWLCKKIFKKAEGWTQIHVINPINPEVKGQRRIRIMNVLYIFYYGIHPCAKYGMSMSGLTEVTGRTWRHVKNSINLTLRSKFKVVSGSWMFAIHRLMVIHPYAKHGKPMSNKINYGRDTILHRRTDREWFLYI